MFIFLYDFLYEFVFFIFFFFKQKTAYEMRISDWSSDVCSSDLGYRQGADQLPDGRPLDCGRDRTAGHLVDDVEADGDRGAMFQIAFFETDRGADLDLAQAGLEEVAHACVGAEPVGHDRDEAAARAEAPKKIGRAHV